MSTRRYEHWLQLREQADTLEADRDDLVAEGRNGSQIDSEVVSLRAAADRLMTPPEGWVMFGTNAGTPHVMEFSVDLDEEGMPLFERVIADATVPDEIPTDWLEG
jgi:hypothetical protein